jgi:hypothetical protein
MQPRIDQQLTGEVQQRLRELFDAAAAKSLAVMNQDDAEPEMVRFLRMVRAHPEERAFVMKQFTDTFSESFYMRREPWEFLQFCMHDLRWPEMREFIREKRDQDVQKRGSRSSGVWNDILAAFEDNWDGAKLFREFGKSQGQGLR